MLQLLLHVLVPPLSRLVLAIHEHDKQFVSHTYLVHGTLDILALLLIMNTEWALVAVLLAVQ